MLKSTVTIFTIVLLFTSCASRSDVEALQARLIEQERLIDTYQRRSTERIKQFERNTDSQIKNAQNQNESFKTKVDTQVKSSQEDMAQFKKAYNPDFHNKLRNNLSVSEKHYKQILALLNEAQKQETQITKLVAVSKKHSDLTIANAKASEVKNVVNEFEALSKKWQQRSKELDNVSAESQKAVKQVNELSKKSTKSVKELSALAIKSEKAALQASKDSKKVHELKKIIKELEDEIEELEDDLKDSQKTLKARQKNIDLLFELYKSLNSRVDNLVHKK